MVDDQPEFRLYVSALLEREIPGARIVVAINGRDALAKLAATTFDLIVTDERMPEMSGLEFLAQSVAIAQHTPTILLTGYADAEMAIRSVAEGRVDVLLSKVTTPATIVSVARELLADGNGGRRRGREVASKRSVLVVDDVPEIVEYIKAVLQRYKTHPLDIHLTSDAQEGIELARTRAFDLVISDFLMPHVNGIEILKAARARNPDGSRVLITGYNEIPTSDHEIADAGISEQFTKPVTSAALLRFLDAHLSYDKRGTVEGNIADPAEGFRAGSDEDQHDPGTSEGAPSAPRTSE